MTDPVFERYKEALKAGHVAALRGRLEEALEHYHAAAEIAAERPVPHTSAGGILLQLGRPDEALAAFDAALERSPADEAALAGRAESLAALGAQDAERREPAPVAAPLADLEPGETQPPGDAVAESPVEPDAVRVEASPDPARHLSAAESLLVGDDRPAAALELIAAAEDYVALDLLDAALEAAGQALRVAPDLPAVHLALARLYFRRGWRERAADTLLLLDRFLEIEGDADARAATAVLARQHLAADPRLERLAGAADRAPG